MREGKEYRFLEWRRGECRVICGGEREINFTYCFCVLDVWDEWIGFK